ncbi:MAG: L-fucose:H+ symporter permease [Bacteroidales bacterium]|jgi:FHS family L-fucose permease-like MFS transporter
MEKQRIIPRGIILPFILLTTLFFAWAVPNNLTDTMLAAFKRIMSISDSKTAWIQVVCYLLGYGCFAIPSALFIKRYTYKSGVMLGLGLYAVGALMFYPALSFSEVNISLSFYMFLLAIFILFTGLSFLETSTNSYVCALGPEETATQRLNFAQSFNPFGAIFGVVISQIFILSQLNTMSSTERAMIPVEDLAKIQNTELTAVSFTYIIIGVAMALLLLVFLFTKMPNLKENDKTIDFKGTFKRLTSNKNYVWGVIAQFFYVGAQIAVWSFVIRYAMQQLNLDAIIVQLGENATSDQIMSALRNVEPVAAAFYNFCDWIGLDSLLPRTSEQAGATYYIMSLILFVIARFFCTALMRFISPRKMLTALSVLAIIFCLVTIYGKGNIGVYALMGITGCMSLMFPTIYGLGIKGLGNDTKIGGAGMVMAIAGAALLTQIQGIVSDQTGSIELAYWVPTIAFSVIAYYSAFISKNQYHKHKSVQQ